eukprot:2611785-Ditylum_brightwellii.AAC.1
MKLKLDDNEDNFLKQLLAELHRILNSRISDKSTNKRKKLQAVTKGHTIGIFTKWEGPGGAQESVLGYNNNYHTEFYDVEETLQFIEMHMTK